MLEGIIAAIATVLVVACIALLVYILRGRSSRSDIVSNDEIESIETYGVGSASPAGASASPGGAPGVHVKTSEESLAKPSQRLSGRFGGLAAFVAAVFAALGAKLWSMQLLGNAGYADEARENLMKTVSTPAPRGCIYDRHGRVLVKNNPSQTVLAEASVADDNDVIKRLSAVLGIPEGVVRQRVKDESQGAQSQRVVASGVRLRDVAFISEHSDAYPGISIEQRTLREYPYGALAAHALGYTGAPTEEELEKTPKGRVIESNDIIGKSGVELYYDGILSGEKGSRRMVVDAAGKVVNVVGETDPQKGSDVHLSLDLHAQYVADKALAETIAPEGDIGTGAGVSASVVAMDLRDGGITVMANYPTYDLTHLTDGIPQDIWELYNSEESHSPFINRAINGQYPPASTFKAFTAMAGLAYGFANYGSTWRCTGEWDGFGSGDIQKCWELKGHGTLDLHGGIVNSCDVVFYDIAKSFFDHGPEGTGELSETALQEYIRQYGFGDATGIDLDGESTGRVPTPEWKADQWRNVPSEALWLGGDYSNMIIGQGDMLVTPVQQACAYCAIATGRILKPHLIKEVRNGAGDVVFSAEAEVVAEPDVDNDHLEYVRRSLHDMLASNNMLSSMYARLGVDAAAKSGTAEHTDREDDAWFAAYAPYDDPRYVCVCVVEQGGSGSTVAGPIVGKVLAALQESDENPEAEAGYIGGSSGVSRVKEFKGGGGRQD